MKFSELCKKAGQLCKQRKFHLGPLQFSSFYQSSIKIYQNIMSQMIPNEMDVKSIDSTRAQQHKQFQQHLPQSVQETIVSPTTQLKNHNKQTDLNDDDFTLEANQEQKYESQSASPDKRHLSLAQPNKIKTKGNQKLPKNIYTQIQPGPTQQQLARLTKQQRQLLSRGKDIIGYIHSNEQEFYENFNKKELEQMDQELRSLYLLRLYGGPFVYTEMQFINYHIRSVESIVNKAEEIVPRLKSLLFKTIKFFVPESYRRKPMGKEGKYQYDSHQDQEERKNLKDQ